MKETQKVYMQGKKINEVLYAVAYWNTLSESQKELIFDQLNW